MNSKLYNFSDKQNQQINVVNKLSIIKFILLSVLTIFITEFLIIEFFLNFPIENYKLETFLDSFILSLIICPFLYFYLLKNILYQNNQLFTQLLKQKEALDSSTLISETDLNGSITYANEQFCKISGYTEEELIGNKHRILSSALHSKDFWKSFWATLLRGRNMER